MKHHYAILGGGIGGLSLAIALTRRGYHVTVYEAAPEWRPVGAGLGLAGNAIKAFRAIGIDQDVLAMSRVLKKVAVRSQSGKALMVTDSEEVSRRFGVTNNFTIHRADLHQVLISQLQPGTVQLGKACIDIVQHEHGVTLEFKDGTRANHDFLIAADGIHSPVRKKLLPNSKTRYAGYTCWRGVTEHIPQGLDMDETSETWGPGCRIGIVPMTHGRIYWFACVNASENNAILKSLAPRELLTFFKNFHAPIPELVENTPANRVIWNDIIDLEPLTQFAFNRVVLMGDAAHATTPNMGQGACMAIEDAVVLANCLDANADPIEAFRSFEQKRIRRTTKVVNDSWQIGKMAQWDNPLLTTIRNFALPFLPQSVTDKQFKFIYDVSLT